LNKALALLFVTWILGFGLPAGAQKTPDKPTSHTQRMVQGWKVRVDDRLLTGPHAELGTRALARLDHQLSDVVMLMHPEQLAHLQAVTIQLDYTNGDLKSPQYHPNGEWLVEHGYDKALEKCVHIPDATYYVGTRFQREQPFAIMHELAHSYHDQVLNFDNPEILEAYHNFEKSGKYNSVLHISGHMERHYALTNQMEFFAEMTESYFGANDFYPFNSAELQKEEPVLFKLLQKIWGPLP